MGPRVSVLPATAGVILGLPSPRSVALASQICSLPRVWGDMPLSPSHLPHRFGLSAARCPSHRVNEVSQVNVDLLVHKASRVLVVFLALLVLMVPK